MADAVAAGVDCFNKVLISAAPALPNRFFGGGSSAISSTCTCQTLKIGEGRMAWLAVYIPTLKLARCSQIGQIFPSKPTMIGSRHKAARACSPRGLARCSRIGQIFASKLTMIGSRHKAARACSPRSQSCTSVFSKVVTSRATCTRTCTRSILNQH